MDSGKEHVWNK